MTGWWRRGNICPWVTKIPDYDKSIILGCTRDNITFLLSSAEAQRLFNSNKHEINAQFLEHVCIYAHIL